MTPPQPRSLDDLHPLSPAEEDLVAICAAGERLSLGDLPEPDAADRRVRANLIRILMLSGGANGVGHEKGIWLAGAVIVGRLELDLCDLRGRLALVNCQVPEGIGLPGASIGRLVLDGSHVAGLDGIHMQVTGSVLLREGFTATGQICLNTAKIGGQLSLDSASLSHASEGESTPAFRANGIDIRGDVSITNGFHSTGMVDLSGGTFHSQLEIVRATLAAESGPAISLQGALVGEIFYWRDVEVPTGNLILSGLTVSALSDDMDSWPADGRLLMDGFTYGRFAYADARVRQRMDWLARHVSTEFQPQPHQQLAKVLGEMGHRIDRSRVMIDMERRIRRQQRKDIAANTHRGPIRNRLMLVGHKIWDTVFYWTVSYGYRPWQVLGWALPIILITAIVAGEVWRQGDFAPNAAPVLVSQAWQSLALDDTIANPAQTWSANDGPGRDYETFKSSVYALDLLIPIVNLGQEDAWAPSTSRGPWGKAFHWALPVIEIIGWMITALSAAAVTGVIRRD